MIFFSASRLAACFCTSLRRLRSRLTIEVLAMILVLGSVAEREVEGLEQRLGFLVGLGRGGDGDIHATDGVDGVEVDLGEDDLLLDAHVEVAPAIERTRRDAAEVAHAGQRNVDQAVQELVHPGAAQGHFAADRPAVADLEAGDRDAGVGGDRLLAGDLGHLLDGVLQHLLVADSLAHAHVQRDLADARHLHRVLVTEALDQLRHDLFLVNLLKPGHGAFPQASIASPLERKTRTLLPSSRTLIPMRSPVPVAGLSSITLEMWIGASRSTMPPATPACGFGLV